MSPAKRKPFPQRAKTPARRFAGRVFTFSMYFFGAAASGRPPPTPRPPAEMGMAVRHLRLDAVPGLVQLLIGVALSVPRRGLAEELPPPPQPRSRTSDMFFARKGFLAKNWFIPRTCSPFSPQNFAAAAAKKLRSVFGQGVYLAKNSSRPVSVRAQRVRRNGLQLPHLERLCLFKWLL